MDISLIWLIIPIILIAVLVLALKNLGDAPIKTVIGIFVCVLLIGAVLVPILEKSTQTDDDSLINELKSSTNVQYDDYYDASNITSCSGSFELVTIGDYTLIHAADVGDASVEWNNGNTTTYTIEKAPLDVFLIMGQSNAAYFHNHNYQCDPIPMIGSSYYFGTSERPLVYTSSTVPTAEELATILPDCGMYSMTSSPGEAHISNFDAPFAAEYYKLTQTKTYVINTGITGIKISTLVPNGSNYHYTTAVFEAAMDAIDTTKFTPSFKGYIWAQGEGDSSTAVDDYKTMFLEIYEAIGDNSFNATWSTDKAYIIKTRALDGGYACTAQIELAEENDGIYIATTLPDTFTVENGLLDDDGIHYSQLADNLIGVAVAEYIESQA